MCLFPRNEYKISSFFQERKIRAPIELVNVSLFILFSVTSFSFLLCNSQACLCAFCNSQVLYGGKACLLQLRTLPTGECLAHSWYLGTYVNTDISRTMDWEQRAVYTSELTDSEPQFTQPRNIPANRFLKYFPSLVGGSRKGRCAWNPPGDRTTACGRSLQLEAGEDLAWILTAQRAEQRPGRHQSQPLSECSIGWHGGIVSEAPKLCDERPTVDGDWANWGWAWGKSGMRRMA